MPDLKGDIVGRVRRLPLPATERSALLPLFEAIHNGLHAIEHRHKGWSKRRGKLTVEIHRDRDDPSIITGYAVTDNGIGITNENFAAFLTPDSQHKIKRGGKGVGRLYWLRVFEKIRIESNYESVNRKTKHRRFDFILANSDQVRNLKTTPSPTGFGQIGTRVALEKYVAPFSERCPTDVEKICARLVSHFLPPLASETSPVFEVRDGSRTYDLRHQFTGAIAKQKSEKVSIELGSEALEIDVRHIRCDKSVKRPGQKFNWIYLCADDRCVEEYCIDTPLGLQLLEDDQIYLACVSGAFLNSHVNQERSAFTFDTETNELLRKKLIEAARKFLTKELAALTQEKRENSEAVIQEHPQFIYLKPIIESFVAKLPPNCVQKEDIYIEMCRNKRRRIRQFDRLKTEIVDATDETQGLENKVDEFQDFIQSEQAGALAEYVFRRKTVLVLLEKLQSLRTSASGGQRRIEEAIHKLICPMRTDSSTLQIGDHNLWVLDDRLAFSSFFASDQKLDKFSSVASEERPDLLFFFDSCSAFTQGEGHYHKVVLVEFKKPGRDDYTSQDNPVRQLVEYLKKLQDSNALDVAGKLLTGISRKTNFYCFIIADLTPSFRRHLQPYQFTETPSGTGMFAHLRNPDAYIEVVQYDQMVTDANYRNKIFFEKLGLA